MLETRWSEPRLEALRGVGDPAADAVIRRLIESGGASGLEARLSAPIDGPPPTHRSTRDAAGELAAATDRLPAWADPAQIQKAQVFFSRYRGEILVFLGLASLPEIYCAANAANLLSLGTRITQDVGGRLSATARMLLDVMHPDGLKPSGRGIRSLHRVRLLHSYVRHTLQQSPRYDRSWGVPICQEDLAGTLVRFSWTPLRCLQSVGEPLESGEVEAWVHTWSAIGHLLGLAEELLPANQGDAVAFADVYERRQFRHSLAGATLARALLRAVEGGLPPGSPAGIIDEVVRDLIGDDNAALLGLDGDRSVPDVFAAAETFSGSTAGARPTTVDVIRMMAGRAVAQPRPFA
jgi:hypothetical protein